MLLRLFKQWPKALRLSFDRLKEKLNDENQGVVSAAVYVICELAAKNPKNYLSLAPQFFKILTTSSNNWSSSQHHMRSVQTCLWLLCSIGVVFCVLVCPRAGPRWKVAVRSFGKPLTAVGQAAARSR